MRACREPRCPNPSVNDTPYCAKHAKPQRWGHDKRPNTTQRGYGGDWARVRKQVLKRDHFECRVCGDRANVVHHDPPISGPDDPERTNPDRCVSLCRPCHERAHGRAT